MVADLTVDGRKARELLASWFHSRPRGGVVLHEETNPRADPHARYNVVYEARLVPPALDQMQVEVWVTSDGGIAVGIERTERVAERLGARLRRHRFAAGHEPAQVALSGLVALLDLVAEGGIGVEALVPPLLGLTQTKAVLLHGSVSELRSRGYEACNWIETSPTAPRLPFTRLLPYRPWS